MNPDILAQFQSAMAYPDREVRLLRLVLELKQGGGSEQDARDVLYALDETVYALGSGGFDTDRPADDAICNVLDCVGGWCRVSCHIFGNSFDEEGFEDLLISMPKRISQSEKPVDPKCVGS